MFAGGEGKGGGGHASNNLMPGAVYLGICFEGFNPIVQ